MIISIARACIYVDVRLKEYYDKRIPEIIQNACGVGVDTEDVALYSR